MLALSTPEPLKFSNICPTSEAVRFLLAVSVKPLTVTVSPLFMAFKVSAMVEAVPVTLLAGSAATPCVNTCVGVGSTPFLRTKLNATPSFTADKGFSKPSTLSAEMLRCCCASCDTVTEWLPGLAVAVVVTLTAVGWLICGTKVLNELWFFKLAKAVCKSFKTNLTAE